MKNVNNWLGMVSLFFALAGLSSHGFSEVEKTTLITLKNGKPVAALAKSWKKVSAGKYEFQLDTKATIGKKRPLTQDAVKSSLEGKLGSTMGVAVTPKGKSAVVVSFSSEEPAFLEAVATAKIRASRGVELALESTTTQGGIRARATDRAPTVDEVKAMVVTNSKGIITLRVLEPGTAGEAPKFKAGEKAKVAMTSDVKPTDVVYFIPDALNEGTWTAKSLVK